jgi:hypothetical protein
MCPLLLDFNLLQDYLSAPSIHLCHQDWAIVPNTQHSTSQAHGYCTESTTHLNEYQHVASWVFWMGSTMLAACKETALIVSRQVQTLRVFETLHKADSVLSHLSVSFYEISLAIWGWVNGHRLMIHSKLKKTSNTQHWSHTIDHTRQTLRHHSFCWVLARFLLQSGWEYSNRTSNPSSAPGQPNNTQSICCAEEISIHDAWATWQTTHCLSSFDCPAQQWTSPP